MTNEKLYFEICEMLKCYDRETGRDYGGTDEWLQDVAAMRETAKYDGSNIYASAARILLDLREKMDKKATGAGRLNVCKRLVKDCARESLAGMHETGGGKFGIVDGFRAFRFTADLPSIPRAKMAFSIDDAMKNCENGQEVPAPSVSDVKTFIASHGLTRRGKKGENDGFFLDGWPAWICVNPFFVLDALEALPGCKFIVDTEKAWRPVYVVGDDGSDGIILPVSNRQARAAWDAEIQRRGMKHGKQIA